MTSNQRPSCILNYALTDPPQSNATLLALTTLPITLAAQTTLAPVVMISIDGMKPEYIIQAAGYNLKVSVLRRFMTGGTYAEGFVGVVPTVTYPSHTTMVTGVWPAEHVVVD